jgi:hypothetical protein
MRVGGGVFFCVCLRFCMKYRENSIAPNSVPDYNLLRPCVTMHNLQVSEWRKKNPWFQQSSIQTIRFTSNRIRHPLRSHALEIFASGIPKTQQRPSMIDLLPGTTSSSLTIVALRGLDTYWSYRELLQKHQRNAKIWASYFAQNLGVGWVRRSKNKLRGRLPRQKRYRTAPAAETLPDGSRGRNAIGQLPRQKRYKTAPAAETLSDSSRGRNAIRPLPRQKRYRTAPAAETLSDGSRGRNTIGPLPRQKRYQTAPAAETLSHGTRGRNAIGRLPRQKRYRTDPAAETLSDGSRGRNATPWGRVLQPGVDQQPCESRLRGVYVYSILLIWLCSGDNYICQVFK